MQHSIRLAAASALLVTATVAHSPSSAQSLSTEREFWNGEALHEDYVAQFGRDTRECYSVMRDGPEGPDQQEVPADRWIRAVIALDASGSMAGRVGGGRKMDAAKNAVSRFLDGVPEDAEIGILAFGHTGNNQNSGRQESCRGVEMVHATATLDRKALRSALDASDATGRTPLAAAIPAAGEALVPAASEGEQVVFVVSDGLETCGGDPVEAARLLRESDINAVVNIIGFDVSERDRRALEDVASAGGGMFAAASNAAQLRERLRIELGNQLRQTQFELGTMTVRNMNRIQSDTAKNQASACVRRAGNNENINFTTISNSLVRRGLTDNEAVAFVRERLVERQTELDAFIATVDADLEGAEDTMND